MNLNKQLEQQEAQDEVVDINSSALSGQEALSKQEALSGLEAPDKQIIMDYLLKNPDFFNQNTDFLATLKIPHNSGSAVSLIERQVSILREQNTHYKKQLRELFAIARENDQSNNNMHKLILSLLDCYDLNSCEETLNKHLCGDFSVDAVALRFFSEPDNAQGESLPVRKLFVPKDSKLAQELNKLLTIRKPQCGYFKQLPMETLFADKAKSISSLAVIPLFIEKNNCFAALILGSNNMHRFNANIGTIFLERLGEILSHRLIALI